MFLKEPKLKAWAAALELDLSDLRRLWNLCQGFRLVGESLVFYEEYSDDSEWVPPSDEKIEVALEKYSGLTNLYRLAYEISDVMQRLLPLDAFWIQPWRPDDQIPVFPGEDEANNFRGKLFKPFPVLWVTWASEEADGEPAAVVIPRIAPLSPIVRQRKASLTSKDLGAMVQGLNSLERERVRGYIEAIIEERAQ